MTLRIKAALLGLAVLVIASLVSTVVFASPAAAEKIVKRFSAYGEIHGEFPGLSPGSQRIEVELYRRENGQLTRVASAQTQGGNTFEFTRLEPGEYVVTPSLEGLPEGVGLYQRHLFVQVHQEIANVTFTAERVARLAITGGPDLTVADGEVFYVETAAYDAEGRYLFAASRIDAPEDAAEHKRYENGKGLSLKGAGRSVVVRARSGSAAAQATVTVK